MHPIGMAVPMLESWLGLGCKLFQACSGGHDLSKKANPELVNIILKLQNWTFPSLVDALRRAYEVWRHSPLHEVTGSASLSCLGNA